MAANRMLIMVGGPYRSGASTQTERAANLRVLNEAALAVWERGHTPIIGVNVVLPIVEVAGEALYKELMMPICLDLADRCDGFLRVGGASTGADEEMERIRACGGSVFHRIEDIPRAVRG
jgi:hypothetical protein